jgi:hypothetical protein
MALNTKIIRPKVKIKCLSITRRNGRRFEGKRIKTWQSTKNSLAMNCKFKLQRYS